MDFRKELQEISDKQNQIIMVDGEAVAVPVRVPMNGEFVHIDTLNFVFHVSTLDEIENYQLGASMHEIFALDLDLEQYEYMLSLAISHLQGAIDLIFGDNFGKITETGNGIHYYKHGYRIINELGDIVGTVGIGGQNNTVFVGITGTGCLYALNGWESRLYTYLDSFAVDARITRIDLAFDDFDGKFSSFAQCDEAESQKLFMLPKARNRPAVRYAGEYKHNDPLNKGLTIYVGNRNNGKIFRGYEKGKQLGDENSAWFRSEVEIHNKKLEIPLDILLTPTTYFAGFYPYCFELVDTAKKSVGDDIPQFVERVTTLKKEGQISLSKAIDIIRHQFGKYIKTLGDLFTVDDAPDYQKIYESIITSQKKDYVPKRITTAVKLRQNEDFPKEYMEQVKEKIALMNKLEICVKAINTSPKNRIASNFKGNTYDYSKINPAWC